MPVPVQFMKMILILPKCVLLQAPFLGSPSHNWALLLNSYNAVFYLSCPPFSSPLWFRCTCHIFSTRQWTLWPLHYNAVPHVFLEMPRNASFLFIYPACLLTSRSEYHVQRRTQTYSPEDSNFAWRNKYVCQLKSTYSSVLCVTNIKHFTGEWNFPFLFYMFYNSNQRTLPKL